MYSAKIAVQLFTLRDYLKTFEDIRATLRKIKEIGYNAIEPAGFGSIEIDRIKEIIDENELQVCSTHTSFESICDETDRVIKEHKLLNCKYVGIGGAPRKYRQSAEGYREFAKLASEKGKILKDNGLYFIYHNHNTEFIKFDGITAMDILFNESDPDTFGFQIDTYWVQAGGSDPIYWINKVKGRMPIVHLKDMGLDINKNPVYTEVGEGNLNWPGIIEACKDTGVEWYCVEQDRCQRNPFESIEISLKNLKELGLS